MDAKEKAMLIRRGNELFNARDYKNALKIYLAVDYKEGIARMAAIMENEKKDNVTALKLYKKAGYQSNVEKLAYSMAQAVRFLLKEDKQLVAQQKGENFDMGYKVSGQSPAMISSEAIRIAKDRLGLNDVKINKKEVESWRPIIISRSELDRE